MGNISVGGKSYEAEKETIDKIEELLESDGVIEIEDMDSLIGKKWAFQCARYIYYGKVESINNSFIELGDAQVVFETGEYSAKEASDAQDAPKGKMLVMRQAIESIYPVRW